MTSHLADYSDSALNLSFARTTPPPGATSPATFRRPRPSANGQSRRTLSIEPAAPRPIASAFSRVEILERDQGDRKHRRRNVLT